MHEKVHFVSEKDYECESHDLDEFDDQHNHIPGTGQKTTFCKLLVY